MTILAGGVRCRILSGIVGEESANAGKVVFALVMGKRSTSPGARTPTGRATVDVLGLGQIEGRLGAVAGQEARGHRAAGLALERRHSKGYSRLGWSKDRRSWQANAAL